MQPGQQVTPTLRLARLLGHGGMGSVWVADHGALGTQVAVKFMSPLLAQQPGFAERFRREAMAAARIKSPHVAQVFDHGITVDGLPYIVMELLEGEDLKTRIERLGPLPPAEVVHVIGQAAKALGRAHEMGIVHRDVKPDNLFLIDVDRELFVKVLDFGIAKQIQGGDFWSTSTGSTFGTPLYMSPEQLISPKQVDGRSDLWSLGVVAYHALTGRVPFAGETLGALTIAICDGKHQPPSAIRPGLPAGIDAWMAKALARDQAVRFSSAREMVDALEQAVGVAPRRTQPSAAELDLPRDDPTMPLPPDWQGVAAQHAQGRTFAGMARTGKRSRRPSTGTLIAAAIVICGIGAGVSLGYSRRTADHGDGATSGASTTTGSAENIGSMPVPRPSAESHDIAMPPSAGQEIAPAGSASAARSLDAPPTKATASSAPRAPASGSPPSSGKKPGSGKTTKDEDTFGF